MEITEHAIDSYISRVIGLEPNMAGGSIRKRAADKIRDTVDSPEEIKQRTPDDDPVYIRGDVAVPVSKGSDGELYVPTAYLSATFKNNTEKNEQATA